MAGEDFVQVKLSAAGEKAAGPGGALRIANGRRAFAFEAGKVLRIERSYEWSAMLARETCEGAPMFEIVQSAPAPSEEK